MRRPALWSAAIILPLLLVLGVAAISLDIWPSTGRLGVSGLPPVEDCAAAVWPESPITCEAAYRQGAQAGARVDSASIWLSTLGQARSSLAWSQQVTEPADSAMVWVIAYSGRYRCCPNAFDESGRPIPQEVRSQWLIVSDAFGPPDNFIFTGDWSDRDLPRLLPGPTLGVN